MDSTGVPSIFWSRLKKKGEGMELQVLQPAMWAESFCYHRNSGCYDAALKPSLVFMGEQLVPT